MYVPAPWSIHPGIFKLEPGTFLKINKQPPTHPPSKPIRPDPVIQTLVLRDTIRLQMSLKD